VIFFSSCGSPKHRRRRYTKFPAELRYFPGDFLALSRNSWWPSSFLISWHQEFGFALIATIGSRSYAEAKWYFLPCIKNGAAGSYAEAKWYFLPCIKNGAAGGRPCRLATAARRWPVARDRSPAWFGTCSEGSLCALVARTIFLPQDVHIFLPNMIAVAGGGTNAMGVSKNVRAWRCKRCPARLQASCPGGGLLLLVAWASADVRQILLQRPHARHPSPILEGLLSRYRLARGAFASCCRSFVFVSFA
jgi:ribosomal protein L37E